MPTAPKKPRKPADEVLGTEDMFSDDEEFELTQVRKRAREGFWESFGFDTRTDGPTLRRVKRKLFIQDEDCKYAVCCEPLCCSEGHTSVCVHNTVCGKCGLGGHCWCVKERFPFTIACREGEKIFL